MNINQNNKTFNPIIPLMNKELISLKNKFKRHNNGRELHNLMVKAIKIITSNPNIKVLSLGLRNSKIQPAK